MDGPLIHSTHHHQIKKGPNGPFFDLERSVKVPAKVVHKNGVGVFGRTQCARRARAAKCGPSQFHPSPPNEERPPTRGGLFRLRMGGIVTVVPSFWVVDSPDKSSRFGDRAGTASMRLGQSV